MANPNEPRGQRAQQTASETRCYQCHLALLVAPRVVPPPEGYLVTIERQQPVIADGDAVV